MVRRDGQTLLGRTRDLSPQGLRPEKYAERRQVRGALANLDLNLLPNEAIERIANGEPVGAVLASMAAERVPRLLKPER